MGIPGFNTWFSNKHKDAYLPLSHVQVDHLYIDMNSVLHNVMRSGAWVVCYLHSRMSKYDLNCNDCCRSDAYRNITILGCATVVRQAGNQTISQPGCPFTGSEHDSDSIHGTNEDQAHIHVLSHGHT